MNDNKNSFILYHDQREIFKKLSKELAGELIQAIFDYEVTGEMPELSEILSFVIIPIKQAIDRNRLKYNEIREKRIKAGYKGGKQTQANQASACFANKNQANACKNEANQASSSVSVPVSVPVPVPVPVNVNVNNLSKEKYKKESLLIDDVKNSFDCILTAYQGKRNKEYALECFKKTIKEQKIKDIDALEAFKLKCFNAIEQQKQEKQIKAQNGVFVAEWKNLSTWINQKCWNDDVDLTIHAQTNQQTPRTAGQRNVEFMDWLRQKKQEQINQQKIGENKNADKKINGC